MNNLAQLHIDRTKCSGCGRCVQVCPNGAIRILGKDPKDSLPAPPIETAAPVLDALVANRRSHRRYQARNVEKETIRHLIGCCKMRPTAETSCRSNMHWSTMSNRWTGCERSLLNGWTHWLPVGSIQMAMTQKAFRISSGPKRPYDRICCFAALPTC